LASDLAIEDLNHDGTEFSTRKRWVPNSPIRRTELLDELERLLGDHEGAHVFHTTKGFIGLAPRTSQPGDIVCLILGAEVPLLIRTDGDKYVFVGECYVHGIMDGEGLVEARRRAQPDFDHTDTSWLGRLQEEPIPFEIEEFILI
jgi:hypothetical protein